MAVGVVWPAAVALIWPLAWELPYATGMALKKKTINKQICVFVWFLFLLFKAASAAYGSSQARGQIRTTTAGLCHSHSSAGSLTP